MKLWLAKVTGRSSVGLVPTDQIGEAYLQRLGDGECIEAKIIRPRSVQWNKMYFGICREIGNNQDPARSEDSIDAEVRVRGGHFEVMLVDGHECRVPKRIAFDQLSGDEWAELWPSLELAIREHFGEEYIRERAA